MLADGMVFTASYNSKTTILKEGSAFDIINQIDLGEKIGASPVAIDNRQCGTCVAIISGERNQRFAETNPCHILWNNSGAMDR